MLAAKTWIALCAVFAFAGCSRASGVEDQDLGGLVVAQKPVEAPIDVARAASDPGELTRALMQPVHDAVTAIGPHTLTITTQTDTLDAAGSVLSTLQDSTKLELGSGDDWHGVYENSADYGREVIAPAGGKQLYLKPRYQRWHARAPEGPDEPGQLRDSFATAIGATWDLLAPGAELTNLGAATVAGRAGVKIAVKLTPQPRANPPEPLPQRAWRQARSIEALDGEVVLDRERGVPLSVKLAGVVGFTRGGVPYKLKVSVTSAVSGVGAPVAIVAPDPSDTVQTPERLREVDDRDFLLQGMAPPARVKPSEPALGSAAAAAAGSAAP